MISSARLVAVLAAFAVGSAPAAEKKGKSGGRGGDDVELAPLVAQKARSRQKAPPAVEAAPAEELRRWSVVTGGTLGDGRMAVHLRAGWPGADVTALWGLGARFDAGARVTANYGMEGNPSALVPGFKASVVLRASLFETSLLTFGAELAPGGFAYLWPIAPYFGVTAPLTLSVGVAPLPYLSGSVWASGAPLWNLSPRMTVDWTYRFGLGVEYHFSRQLAVTLELGAGALRMVAAPRGYMAYNTQLGIACAL